MFEKKTRRSFLVSLIIHGIIGVILACYILGIDERVEQIIDMTFYEPAKVKPRTREYRPKVLPKPLVSTEGAIPISSAEEPSTRQFASSFSVKSTVEGTTVTEYTNRHLTGNIENPAILTPAQNAITVATAAKFSGVSDVSLPEGTPTPGATTVGTGMPGGKSRSGGNAGGSGTGRGSFGSGPGQDISNYSSRSNHPGLAMTKTTDVTNLTDSLEDIATDVSLGGVLVEPLPKGEPGGRVIGKGKDIKGVIRFTRLKHRLSDWWADPTSVIGLVNWLNAKTQIRADLNVEGGAVKLTDANLLKMPLIIMTGHDPAVVRCRMATFQAVQPTPLEKRMPEQERLALRKYLVAKGGLLFYDDCGLNSAQWPLMQMLINELRTVMPEYAISPIPNDHELYSCFYELGGPPWGVATLWKHDGPKGPISKNLKGIFIADRLAVIFSQRDYLCAAKTVNVHAGKVHRVSGAYKFMINVAVYALTHGGISDYADYVPDDRSKDQKFPKRAPITPRATPNSEQ